MELRKRWTWNYFKSAVMVLITEVMISHCQCFGGTWSKCSERGVSPPAAPWAWLVKAACSKCISYTGVDFTFRTGRKPSAAQGRGQQCKGGQWFLSEDGVPQSSCAGGQIRRNWIWEYCQPLELGSRIRVDMPSFKYVFQHRSFVIKVCFFLIPWLTKCKYYILWMLEILYFRTYYMEAHLFPKIII